MTVTAPTLSVKVFADGADLAGIRQLASEGSAERLRALRV